MGDKTYKCRYAFCPYPDKAIHPEDNCKKVGRLYFHADCYEKKQKGEWKDSRTKADLQEIKIFWTENISNTVNYSRLFQVLNGFLARGISSDYLLFVVRYCVRKGYKLSYPDGLKYYLDKSEIKEAYKKKLVDDAIRAMELQPNANVDAPIEEQEERKREIKPRRGFHRILRGDKNKEI